MTPAIVVKDLEKYFKIKVADEGPLLKRVLNYISPKYELFTAVNKISFNIQLGERVAFIGPNGAGKSTTLKILTGIVHPNAGQVKILGMTPAVNRKHLSLHIGAIFGQRSQLLPHLPVNDTMYLLSVIYDIPYHVYQKRLKDLTEKFEITHLLNKPARQLSLGERMRCEIAAVFLHQPSILFLDEPTIGLDIHAKSILRNVILEQSQKLGTTLLLTSHDMVDIEKVCDRVIVIDHGALLLDDRMVNLRTKYTKKKIITLFFDPKEEIAWRKDEVLILEHCPSYIKLEIDITKHTVTEIIAEFSCKFPIKDVLIEDPSLETTINTFYRHGKI